MTMMQDAEGDMFIVKDPDVFASSIIPQYFDHNKYRPPTDPTATNNQHNNNNNNTKMATLAGPQPGKIDFAGMVGAKRRRMRSGGNVSTLTNNSSKHGGGGAMMMDQTEQQQPMQQQSQSQQQSSGKKGKKGDDEKTAQTSKCKGATTIPIFLKKTYKMIDTCDPSIASWNAEGDMFIVKDPDVFASSIIPQYFDHNKFSSFARQLNFYGFRKMQSKPIRNSDFDAASAKHVTFYNENFKRGRCDLLKNIQRSTRGGGSSSSQDAHKEIAQLKDTVAQLEKKIEDMSTKTEERIKNVEAELLGRMEQLVLTVQFQQSQIQRHTSTSTAGVSNARGIAPAATGIPTQSSIAGQTAAGSVIPEGWDPLPYGARASSIGSIGSFAAPAPVNKNLAPASAAAAAPPAGGSGPTLPPHPKQKMLPPTTFPGAVGIPTSRLTSLRGLSLTRGISGLSRGASIESSASGLLNNNWEDKFFSMMLAGNQQQQQNGLGGDNGRGLSIASNNNNNNNNANSNNNSDFNNAVNNLIGANLTVAQQQVAQQALADSYGPSPMNTLMGLRQSSNLANVVSQSSSIGDPTANSNDNNSTTANTTANATANNSNGDI
eukprot:CAMPEP_0119571406 /NCGR_PEP_ID=MMETSP1352-20130426/44103_1 /TAXON_ID=265584 /ORGANISM="Stauroneis constricta, Strain CCMP1120" /LENGTH=601 /DNA_ID=CAMNT_0007621085 /DNA_START=299 /DNA_END=2105 /DNA_ORIENTATION=+